MSQLLLGSYDLPTHSSSFWWVRYPRRAVEEIRQMEENTNAMLFCEGSSLIFKEEIVSNFGTHFLLLIKVGSNYPFSMPDVYVVDSDIDVSNAKHQYSEGRFCLMHPSDYNSNNTSILEIRNLAAAWCWCAEVYLNTGEWPAAEAD